MSQSLLTKASALNPGADLWILPDLAHSHILKEIDWYLKFQITRNSRHVSQQISEPLKHLLEQSEFPAPAPLKNNLNLNTEALMIPPLGALPCRWIVIVPAANFKFWVEKAHSIWQSLGCPSIRFFLPNGQSTGSLAEIWQTYSKEGEYTLVID